MKLGSYFLAANIWLLPLSAAVAQASQQTQSTEINPFNITIINGSYDFIAHRILIVLTDKELRIFDQTGMTDLTDSLLFSKILSPSDTLSQISKVNFDHLKYGYLNPCVENGSHICVSITKNGRNKQVFLGNYYQRDVGNFLSMVNKLVPQKYRVWYDKESLEAENCAGYESGEAIQLFDSASGNFLRLDSTHTSVFAIDKNGRILWKTDLDRKYWNEDIIWPRGKNDSVLRNENRKKVDQGPEVGYFRLSRKGVNSWCRSPDGSATLGIGFGKAFVGLDVKNGKILCWGQD